MQFSQDIIFDNDGQPNILRVDMNDETWQVVSINPDTREVTVEIKGRTASATSMIELWKPEIQEVIRKFHAHFCK
jgi:hypothetical protein